MKPNSTGFAYKNLQRRNLVIFDYSGTLSLGAVLFGKDKTISQALKNSGLAALGVQKPEVFWTELVEPTWEEGSTTKKGYTTVLTDRAAKLLDSGESKPDRTRIREAVSHFVDAYLSYSLIDPRWEPALQFLNSRSDTDIVIATDHYAETTEHIINELYKIGIKAAPLDRALRQEKFFIANSADLACHKSNPKFWYTLKDFLGPGHYNQILLLDDFGFNEQEDFYGGKTKALKRREMVTATIKEIFAAELKTFSFFLEHSHQDGEGLSRAYLELIENARSFLETHIC